MSARRLFLTMIGAAGLLLATAATVWACSPNALIRLPLTSAPAGTTVTVQGQAFERGPVRVQWVPTGEVLLQTRGPSFAVPVTIPEGAPAGVHHIEALGFNDAGEQVGHTSAAFTVQAAPGGDAPEEQPIGSAPEEQPIGSAPEEQPVTSPPAEEPVHAPPAQEPAGAPAAQEPATPPAGAPAAQEPAGAPSAPQPAGTPPAQVPDTAPAPAATAPAPGTGNVHAPAAVASSPSGEAALAPSAVAAQPETASSSTAAQPAAGDPAPREHVVPPGVHPVGHDGAAAPSGPSPRTASGDLWTALGGSDRALSLGGAGATSATSGQSLLAVGPAALGIGMVLLFGVTFTLVARRRGILVAARTHSGDVADR